MTVTKKDPVLAVLQLSGGNDAMNTKYPTLTLIMSTTDLSCESPPTRYCRLTTRSDLTRQWGR